ncbi:hypothetical protein ACN47E_005902 [Coniothyrium glycines]
MAQVRYRGMGTEKELVENEATAVYAQRRAKTRDLVRDTDEVQDDERSGQRGNSPGVVAACLHEEDRGKGADQKGTAAYERCVAHVICVEADLRHECAHVAHYRMVDHMRYLSTLCLPYIDRKRS